MTSRYEAYMDNVSLSSIDNSIYVIDISYSDPKINNTFINAANRSGAIIENRRITSAQVTITFEIHKYSISDRNEVCQKVAKWANGSVLKTNDRSGQQLNVICDKYPSISSAKKWTDPITMIFTAYKIPFWQDSTQTTLTLTGSSTSGSLSVPGNAQDALVEADIVANTSITSVSLTVGNTAITLSGISLAVNNVISIYYDNNQILHIMQGGISILDKRTGNDDLLAKCGTTVTCTVYASDSVTVTFKVRGCWY